MAIYYVRKSGSDSNAGTSSGAAWLTIDKAANSVAAGDTVYVGAGIYRELVTMDTSGSSGSVINFIADVTGYHTGDPGLVIISSFNAEYDTAITRVNCWNMNGKEFITLTGFTMQSSDICITDGQLAGARAYEGVIIEYCALSNRSSHSIDLDLNAGADPSASGLIIRNCKVTSILIRHDNNATANVNVGLSIYNIECHKYLNTNTGSASAGIYIFAAASNTFSIGGVTIANCAIFGSVDGVKFTQMKDTGNVTRVSNIKAYCSGSPVLGSTGVVAAAVECYATANMIGGSANSGVTDMEQFNTIGIVDLFGGFGDFTLYRHFGWSPFLPGEPIRYGEYISPTLAYGQSATYLPTTDLYGNPRGMGRPNHWNKYHFDASDDAISDPNAVWTNEANLVDSSITTNGSCTTVGSNSSNYTFAGGTNAPGSGGTIRGVYVRVRASTSSSRSLGLEIYTNGIAETLLSTTIVLATTAMYTDWILLTPPAGGWTWADIQALEFKAWVVTGGSGSVSIYDIQVAVETSSGHADIGCVEGRGRPEKESTTIHAGAYAAKFNGAGFYETFVPVGAASTTITVYARFDSNYGTTVGKPKMEIFNIPGVADQSITMTSTANTWEQLSINFTPTDAGIVRVRLSSQDESVDGKCFFDDLAIA